MTSVNFVKQQKRAIINQHTRPCNVKACTQVVTTLAPIAVLWYLATVTVDVSWWFTAGITLLMSLFLLRVFVLMHECGHGSLFPGVGSNRALGFIFGVVSGMPQYVWSEHHHYHHVTNGNWQKYRGPLSVLTVDEYAALTEAQQRRYRFERSLWMAPIAGFMYLLFNPRYTWLKGSIALVAHIIRGKWAQPGVSIKAHAASFKTRYWASAEEYWHMSWNNILLLSIWVWMSLCVGPALFFTVYVISVSLSGAGGIVLFTVQHNFEHSYASSDEGWDYDTAAIHGTSFLVLPHWLNWFTANIAYHHIHHLSAKIPNYCLVNCHEEYKHLFGDVVRVKLSQIHQSIKYLLWDTRARRLISVAEYQQLRVAATA